MTKNERLGLVIGLVLGVPGSYYFQSGALKAKMSLGSYLGNLPDLLSKYPGDVFPPLLICCALLGVAGWFIGRQMGSPTPK